MLQHLNTLRLSLDRLSITSVHRLVHDAQFKFAQMMTHFDLNNAADLELRINCSCRHECQDTCMVQSFADWVSFNARCDIESLVRKLSIVHHKSVTELAQFKHILENYAFSALFPNIEELYVNCSNSNCASQIGRLDLRKIISKLHHVPKFRVLHLSSFFCGCRGYRRFLIFKGTPRTMFSPTDVPATSATPSEVCSYSLPRLTKATTKRTG